LGVSARIEIARVASRLFEAASRASLGDARFFGGGFCGLDEPDAVSSSSTTPGPETDVTWEALGDGVVDGWDAFAFDARATCDDALAVSELLLLGANRLFAAEAAAAASLAEAIAARRLADLRRVVDARLKRSAAMADAGALGVSAALLLAAVEGADLPSIAGGAAGRTLAPPPPRPAEIAGDAATPRRRGRRGGDVRGPGPAAFRGRRAFVVDAQRARRVVRRLRARGGGGQGGVRRAARGGGGARAREVADSGGGGGGAQGARRRPRDGFTLFRGFVFYVF
jgi:hypothetical protein